MNMALMSKHIAEKVYADTRQKIRLTVLSNCEANGDVHLGLGKGLFASNVV